MPTAPTCDISLKYLLSNTRDRSWVSEVRTLPWKSEEANVSTDPFSYSTDLCLLSNSPNHDEPPVWKNSHVAGGSFSTIVVKPAISEKNILGDATMNALQMTRSGLWGPMFNKTGHQHGRVSDPHPTCHNVPESRWRGVVTSVAKRPLKSTDTLQSHQQIIAASTNFSSHPIAKVSHSTTWRIVLV